MKKTGRLRLPHMDAKEAKRVLIEFIRDEVTRSPYDKCIMGLSGGIDSAVVACLASEALGRNNLIGLLMPYKTSTADVTEDAGLVAQEIGIRTIQIDISPQIDAFVANNPHDDPRRLGSKMVRERSAILYYYADIHKAVVLGTANKTETLLGYFTKWGDPAADLLPLAELYKTHVRQLACALDLPSHIIQKPPSAGMWPGQKDEDEFGFSYEEADPILCYLVDLAFPLEKLREMNCDTILVDKVAARLRANEFKRKGQMKPMLPRYLFENRSD